MPAKKTKWPRYPDPRGGHFGARGFDPPYAAPWKLRLFNAANTDPLFSFLNTGVVLETFSILDSQIVYWTPRVDPLEPRIFVIVSMANENNLFGGTDSVRWSFDFQVLTIPWWNGTAAATWPVGGFVPSNIFCDFQLPNLIPMAGLLTVTGADWDTPTTAL